MKKYDAHIHFLLDTDLKTSVKYFKEYFKNNDIEKASVMSCPTYAKGDILQNLKALYYKNELKPNVYAFAGLYYENFNNTSNKEFYSNDFYNQVKTYIENGYDGIKILEGKPSERSKIKVMLSDEVFDKMFSFLEDNNVLVTLHNSDPATFWNLSLMTPYQIEKGWYVGDDMPSKAGLFQDVIAVLKKHPKLRLTLAHFGFTTDAIWEAEEFLSYENTNFDCTPGWEQYVNITANADKWRELILNNSTRFMFGTDTENDNYETNTESKNRANTRAIVLEKFFSASKEGETLKTTNNLFIKSLSLPNSVVEKIMYGNAEREFKEVKPINYNYVEKEIERLRKIVKTSDDKNTLDIIAKGFNKRE